MRSSPPKFQRLHLTLLRIENRTHPYPHLAGARVPLRLWDWSSSLAYHILLKSWVTIRELRIMAPHSQTSIPKWWKLPPHCFETFASFADNFWDHPLINMNTNSTAQGRGGSFKNRKPIGEVGCCESRMAERSHWWTDRWLRSLLFLSLSFSFSDYLPTYLSIYVSIYLSIYLPIYLSTYLSIWYPQDRGV